MRPFANSPLRAEADRTRKHLRRRHRRRRPEAALLLLFLLFIAVAGTLSAVASWADHERSLSIARERTKGTALLLAADMRRSVETRDILMRQAAALLVHEGLETLRRSPAQWSRFRNLARAQGGNGTLWVFDENGTAVLGSNRFGPPAPAFDGIDGRPFEVKPPAAGSDLVIGPPILDRHSGRRMLPISRRITFGNDDRPGTILSTLDAEGLTNFYKTLAYRPRPMLAVLVANGDLFFCHPPGCGGPDTGFAQSELFRTHLPNAPVGTIEGKSPLDGTDGILSYRSISGLPIVVATGISTDEALAGWRLRLRWNALIAIAGLGAAAILIWQTLQVMRRNEDSLAALDEAHRRNVEILESISDAFFALDERWTFTYVNAAAERIWGRRRESLLGRNIWSEFPEAFDSEIHRQYRRAAERREPVEFQTFSPILQSWIEMTVYPSFAGLSVYFRDISERKRAEQHQKMLLAELSHRVKNTLAVVLSIASQTRRRSASLEEFDEAFRGRILALANAHGLLTASRWEEARIDALISEALRPYMRGDDTKYRAAGPEISLTPKTALTVALVLHELATNAAKYGALSSSTGYIEIRWSREARDTGPWVRLSWSESGGPKVGAPARRGFGADLIERSIAHELGGKVQLAFCEDGLRCEITFPLAEETDLPSLPNGA